MHSKDGPAAPSRLTERGGIVARISRRVMLIVVDSIYRAPAMRKFRARRRPPRRCALRAAASRSSTVPQTSYVGLRPVSHDRKLVQPVRRSAEDPLLVLGRE